VAVRGPRRLRVLDGAWAICRLAADAPVPGWAAGTALLTAVVRTPRELSIVVPSGRVPDGIVAERDFRVLEVEGPIPFDVTGVMASIAGPLAAAGISLFPLATYDTDYVLVRDRDLAGAVAALAEGGWTVGSRQ
jgi:hypothetical protein